MAMKRKTYRGRLEFKKDSDQTGHFRAEFATLNVIDHDDDVTEPGAFIEGQETVIEAWNHGYDKLPVGKGVIHEEEDKAVIDGLFFLDTEGGLEHYKVVKALGPLLEWSYTFDITDSGRGKFDDQEVRFLRGLDVWGVAPVQRGAGIDTRTVAIKGKEGEAIDRLLGEARRLQGEVDALLAEARSLAGDDDGDEGGDDDGDQGQATGDGGEPSGDGGLLAARVAIELIEAGIDDGAGIDDA